MKSETAMRDDGDACVTRWWSDRAAESGNRLWFASHRLGTKTLVMIDNRRWKYSRGYDFHLVVRFATSIWSHHNYYNQISQAQYMYFIESKHYWLIDSVVWRMFFKKNLFKSFNCLLSWISLVRRHSWIVMEFNSIFHQSHMEKFN